MFKWKIRFYMLISILYLKFINIKCKIEGQDDYNIFISEYYSYQIKPKYSQVKYLYYSQEYKFHILEKNELKDLFVNFYSIDCDIHISTGTTEKYANITQIKKDITSIIIKNKRIKIINILVKPIINSGNNDKNKDLRVCPVVINSLYIGQFEIYIKEKESMALSFNETIPYIKLLYKIQNLNEDSFVTLSFIVDENNSFNIDIKNELNRNISSTSNIFLDYSKLSKIENDTLTIKIMFNKENISEPNYNAVLIFKLIESNSISILRKNILNLGFTISKQIKQYYYLEIIKGDEGEIMLHNKRLYGELFGIITPKPNINPYNESQYIKEYKYNQLHFDPHTLKLSFKSYQTKQCEEACYLFITYSHYNDDYTPIVGFEYTLLARIWDEEEINPQIIDIPFNEYIFGNFEEDSINHHYYSLYIPNDTESIIIQYEGKSIEGFIGYGKRKLNTLRKINNTHNLNLTESQMIRQYNKNELNELQIYNYISFAFRKKFYFKKMLSIYYFRILLLKKGENNIIYPLDSNIGNFCSPKQEKDKYYCYFLLKNDYNEFSLNYSISTSNNNDKLTYNYYKVINGQILGKKVNKFVSQINYGNNSSLVKFMFENEQIVNILSTLSNKKQIIYPQIYSLQMYNLRNNKTFSFNMDQYLLLILNYIYGKGVINFSDLKFYENVNFKGKPFFFYLNDTIKNLSIVCNNELNIYSKFEEINKIKKINQGEALRDIVRTKRLPIYYYIKNGEEEINNLKVHFRIKLSRYQNITAFFDINGYIMNESDFNTKRNINDEFIGLKDPIKGSYDLCFKSGILNINNTIKKGDYILIKIDSYSPLIYDKIIIEIITLLKRDGNYILPINSFITDIYDSSENKSYKIIIDEEDIEKKDIMVEFIPDNSRITIKNYTENETNRINMEDITDNNGIVQKYRITDFNEDFILKVDIPHEISYANYILRYYFTEKQKEVYYRLNETCNKIKKNKDDIVLEYNLIREANITDKIIFFKIFGILYKNENDIKNEFFNSSETINNNIIKNKTFTTNNLSFKLYFSNIKRIVDKNYLFNLQIKISIENEIFNEDLYMYKLSIDLTDELGSKFPLLWIIVISSSVFVIIIIITLLVIVMIKLKKSNKNLKDKVLGISFTSSKIDEDIIVEKRSESKDNAFV